MWGVKVPIAGEGILLLTGIGEEFLHECPFLLGFFFFLEFFDFVVVELQTLLFGDGGNSEEAVATLIDTGVGGEFGKHIVAATYVVVVRIVTRDTLHCGIVVALGEVVVLEDFILHFAHAEGRLGTLSLINRSCGDGESVIVASFLGLLDTEEHLTLGKIDLIAVFLVFLVFQHVVKLLF